MSKLTIYHETDRLSLTEAEGMILSVNRMLNPSCPFFKEPIHQVVCGTAYQLSQHVELADNRDYQIALAICHLAAAATGGCNLIDHLKAGLEHKEYADSTADQLCDSETYTILEWLCSVWLHYATARPPRAKAA